MSIELEKKYRLSAAERDRVIDSLASVGAEFIRRDFEENMIYSSPSLKETGAILRIRKTGERTILTFKQRIGNEFAVKSQIEHETEVADARALEEIISGIGLIPVIVYEKYRDTWRLRSAEVVVDELPFGLFMEVEGAITAIKEAEILLDLDELEEEHETYPRLAARLGVRAGEIIEARFRK